MEKEFVPYEQALALKELGFDDKCFTFYELNDFNIQKKSSFGMYGEITNYGLSKSDILAPLYQQAFRWFREKHNLWVEVKVEDSVSLGQQKYYWSIFGEYKTLEGTSMIMCVTDSDVLGKEFDTYEEAELECLKKLIEICKNN